MRKLIIFWMACLCLSTASIAEVKVGDQFPSFKIPTLDGGVFDTADLKGQVVYVDFWASWCTTCRQSFPALSELSQELKGEGVFFLGINTDEDVNLAHKFLKKTPVSFLNVSDKTQKVVSYFGPAGFPFAYIVDRQGIVHSVKAGFSGKEETKALLLSIAAQ